MIEQLVSIHLGMLLLFIENRRVGHNGIAPLAAEYHRIHQPANCTAVQKFSELNMVYAKIIQTLDCIETKRDASSTLSINTPVFERKNEILAL